MGTPLLCSGPDIYTIRLAYTDYHLVYWIWILHSSTLMCLSTSHSSFLFLFWKRSEMITQGHRGDIFKGAFPWVMYFLLLSRMSSFVRAFGTVSPSVQFPSPFHYTVAGFVVCQDSFPAGDGWFPCQLEMCSLWSVYIYRDWEDAV